MRIPYADMEKASPDLRTLAGERPLNLLRAVAHADEQTVRFLGFGYSLLQGGALPARLRELVILRLCSLTGAAYEAQQHKPMAAGAGLSPAEIAAIEGDDLSVFTGVDRDVMDYASEVFGNVKASDTTFRNVAKALTAAQHIELHYVIGFYLLICQTVVNLEVELET